MKIDWRSVAVVAAIGVVGYVIFLRQSTQPLEQRLATAADSAEKITMQLKLAKLDAIELRTQLRVDSIAHDSLYAKLQAIPVARPPVRKLPAPVDSTDIVALRARAKALEDTVAVLQLDIANCLATTAKIKQSAEALHIADVAANNKISAQVEELQAQIDSVAKTAQGAQQTVKRRWYQKTWSVTKQISEKLLILGAGYGAGKIL